MTENFNAELKAALSSGFKTEVQGLDTWEVDGPYLEPGQQGSYDSDFEPLLIQQEADTFTELLRIRKASGRSTHVLDLFGSGYFLRDLNLVSSLHAVRLKDTDDVYREAAFKRFIARKENNDPRQHHYARIVDYLNLIKEYPFRKVIEGNLYHPKTWSHLASSQRTMGIPDFDLIVARPNGAFANKCIVHPNDSRDYSREMTLRYASIFLRMLNRAYTICAPDSGMIFAESPAIISQHLAKFKQIAESTAKLKVNMMDIPDYWRGTAFSIVKSSQSPVEIEQLITRAFLGSTSSL